MADNFDLPQRIGTPDDLYIQVIRNNEVVREEPFMHCQLDYASENLKNKFQTQSGHSDITIIRKDKLTLNISFRGFQEDVQRCFDLTQEDNLRLSYINPTSGVQKYRDIEMYGLTFSRVAKSEKLETLQNHIGLYDIAFTVEEI